ncbi:MAG: FAD-dependent thymidylate synthase [Deltaproteobacteria bacterium]|jgi:flavin-dependent thymidylate synthase|nr:FAD-dependent thymidylate synthase [Deltaproteobacteria bacterium]
MRVNLAGFNVEKTILEKDSSLNSDQLTPEIISAAYARISRSTDSVEVLRKKAAENVRKARRSNRNIVFEMGHSSIAEHAVFNLDVEGVSRLALEEIERHRLASYTEKSQRYVKVGSDYLIPEEWQTPALQKKLEQLHQECSDFYFELLDRKVPGEDARYYLPFTTTGQVGITVNARSAEHMILAFAASPLAEMRRLGTTLLHVLQKVTPSLIRYVEPSIYNQREYSLGLYPAVIASGSSGKRVEGKNTISNQNGTTATVRLHSFPEQGDDLILAIRKMRKEVISLEAAKKAVTAMNNAEKNTHYRNLFQNIKAWDSLPNEFEHLSFTWEIFLSGAAFAQLKRHRLAGMSFGPYQPTGGFTHPASIPGDLMDKADTLVAKSQSTAEKIASPAAVYALLSGFRRRIIWTVNLRELYHFSRLRQDVHAQWDIRLIADKIVNEVQEKLPLAGALLGGKDSFTEIKKKVMQN